MAIDGGGHYVVSGLFILKELTPLSTTDLHCQWLTIQQILLSQLVAVGHCRCDPTGDACASTYQVLIVWMHTRDLTQAHRVNSQHFPYSKSVLLFT